MPTLQLFINGKEFTATLYDTSAARALLEKLPMILTMQELNGNEKYNYLPFAFLQVMSRSAISKQVILCFGAITVWYCFMKTFLPHTVIRKSDI